MDPQKDPLEDLLVLNARVQRFAVRVEGHRTPLEQPEVMGRCALLSIHRSVLVNLAQARVIISDRDMNGPRRAKSRYERWRRDQAHATKYISISPFPFACTPARRPGQAKPRGKKVNTCTVAG